MNNRFNYKEAINSIKASLFDIYEEQEKLIGLEINEKNQNERLNSFIELKDLAVKLIDKIESLSISTEYVEENEMVKNNTGSIEKSDVIQDNFEEKNDSIQQEKEEYTTSEENNFIKYYLNCNFDKVNFAYVPQVIYEKIKNYKQSSDEEKEDLEDNINSEKDEEKVQVIDNHFYKQDLDKTKGIIVRSDQYMKLALSRHRQVGVLKEAENFRKEEVLKKRKEDQKRELEKAELKFDI